MSESEEELKSLLMKVKEENEKAGLKHSIQKARIMASIPITSWQIDREKVEIVTDFIFLAPKSLQIVTEDIKVKDSPWKESCDKFRQRIKKQRHHFAHKGVCSQSYGFFNSHVRM